MPNFRVFPCRKTLTAAAFAAFTGLGLGIGLGLTSLPAHADNLQEAQRLLKQGQQAQALDQVDKYLAGKPKDAQGRFLKGIILTESGKTNDAIAIFTKLTEDYPELPEPYNNLAVIYAQQKQYEKAKQALEMAIRTHPSYATAHENLGDIYARLASQAYDKALQIDKGNASAQSKLAMIRDIMSTGARSGTKPTTAKPVAPEIKVAETKPVTAPATSTPQPAPAAPAVAAPVATTLPVAPAAAPAATQTTPAATTPPVATAKPAPEAKPAAETKPAAPSSDASANAEIGKTIAAWAAAWSRKDVKGYLSFYAKDFKTPGGESRATWEAERQKRIAKPGTILVSHENLRVTLNGGDRATAKFRQHYKSASLKTSSNKVLEFVHRDGKWLIQQEKIGT